VNFIQEISFTYLKTNCIYINNSNSSSYLNQSTFTFTPGEIVPHSTLIRGKVGSRSSLDVVEKRKISALTNIEPTAVETVA
jgi:hypothetical protein